MSSRSYRPPPGHDSPASSGSSSRRPSPYDGDSDLFGHRPSQAPAAHTPAPSIPPVPSGPGLLGGRMIGAGEDPPPPSFSKGARDENSVLFSVKDLASAAAMRKSTAPVAATPVEAFGDDPTGMVDLRAIANTTQSSLAIKPLDIASLRPSVVPMQAQHPSSMWPTQEDPHAPKPNAPKGPLFYVAIAAAALVFVGFGAGLTAWAMSSDNVDMTASTALAPAADDGVIEREIVQRTKVAEAPEAAASTPSRHSGGRSHGGHASASSKSKSSKTSTAPKKGSDPCNCHGVLACAMRCTK